jgi:low temperature requirement protein LtrA
VIDNRLTRFRRWFWRPPRAHGEVLHDRTVSTLELFYDLVYVAVIIELAHHLSAHLTVRGVIDFAVIFTLIFIAWVNGTLYLELHGHEDGRTRTIVFVQLGLLALLAVFIADAADQTGQAFSVTYAVFLALLTGLWQSARRQERRDPGAATAVMGRYVAFMGVWVGVILVAALLPPDVRLVVWAAFGISWIAGIWLTARSRAGLPHGITPTDALVERFGLLVIIVLGEVFFGVVNGLVTVERDGLTILTGLITLLLGFALWWLYSDLIGRRLPRGDGPGLAGWMLWHLPLTLAIAGVGAAGRNLIEQAHEPATSAGTAWVLAGSVALGLGALVMIERTLSDAARLPSVYRPVRLASIGGAAAVLLVAALQPAPWALGSLLVAILAGLWVFTVGRFMTAEGAVGSGLD